MNLKEKMRRVLGRRGVEFLERKERSLENFWLVALLPLRLVISNI
jgi:hypothetical protein